MALLISFAIGVAIGYLSLALRELGVVTMTLVLALLIGYYLLTMRIGSASAVAIGAGSTVTLLLGNVVLGTLTDPAIHTELPTFVGFLVGAGVLGCGVLLGIVAIGRRT